MFPNEGTAGKFKMKMYRGLKKESEHLHKNFASDPGDYGCGEYWTDNQEFAMVYGDVISKEIELDNVYCIPSDQVSQLIEEYQTCNMELDIEARLQGTMKLTELFKAKGYPAVLTTQYESPDILGLCIFSK